MAIRITKYTSGEDIVAAITALQTSLLAAIHAQTTSITASISAQTSAIVTAIQDMQFQLHNDLEILELTALRQTKELVKTNIHLGLMTDNIIKNTEVEV